MEASVVVELEGEDWYLLASKSNKTNIYFWNSLPPEIWALVLMKQHPIYLSNSMTVCKLWARILSSPEFLLKKRPDIQKYYQLMLLGPPHKDWLNPPEKWKALLSNQNTAAYCPVTCAEADEPFTKLFWDFIRNNWHGKIQDVDSKMSPPPLEVAIYHRGVCKRVSFVFITPITHTGGCHVRLFLLGKSQPLTHMDFTKFTKSRFHSSRFVSLQLLTIFARGQPNAPPLLFHFADKDTYKPPIQSDLLEFDDTILPQRLRRIDGKEIVPSMKRFVLNWYNQETNTLECEGSEDLLLAIWRRKLSSWRKSESQKFERIHVERSEKFQTSASSTFFAILVAFWLALLLFPIHAVINLFLFWICIIRQFWCVGLIGAIIATAIWPAYMVYSFYLVFTRAYDYGCPDFLCVWLNRIVQDFRTGGCDWEFQDKFNFHAFSGQK